MTFDETAHSGSRVVHCKVAMANLIRKGRRVIIAEGKDLEEENVVVSVAKNTSGTLGISVQLLNRLHFKHIAGTRMRSILEKTSPTADTPATANAGVTAAAVAPTAGGRHGGRAPPLGTAAAAVGGGAGDAAGGAHDSGTRQIDRQETAAKRTEEERTIEGSKGRINAVCFCSVAKPLYEIMLAPDSDEVKAGLDQADVAYRSTYPTWNALFSFLERHLEDHPAYDKNDLCKGCAWKARFGADIPCTHLDKKKVRACARKGEPYRGWRVSKRRTTDNGNPGVYVFTGGADATVKMLDATTGKQLHIFRDHAAPVLGLSVSEDQNWLLSCSTDKQCMLYNIELLRERLHEKGAKFDGDYFQPTASFGDALHGPNSDAKSLFSQYSQSSVDLEKEVSELGHDKPVNGGLFARGKNPAFLVTFGQDARTLRYSLATIHADPLQPWHTRDPIPWDLEYAGNRVHGREGASDPSPMGAIRSACFDNPLDLTAPQQFIFTASEDKACRQYNVDTGGLLRIVVGHTDVLTTCILSTDNRFLFSGSLDKSVAMYHIPWAPTTVDLKFIEDAVTDWFLHNDKTVKPDDFVVGAQIYLGDPLSEVVIVILPTGTGGDDFNSGETREIKSQWSTLDKFVRLAETFLEEQPDASTDANEFLHLPTSPWDSARENRIMSVARICVIKKDAERMSKRGVWGHMGMLKAAKHSAETAFGVAGDAMLHAMHARKPSAGGGIGAAALNPAAAVATTTAAGKEREQQLKDDQQLLFLRSCNWDLEERKRRSWMNNHEPKDNGGRHQRQRQHTKKDSGSGGGGGTGRLEDRSFELAPGREMRRFSEPTQSQGILQIQVTKDDQYVFASGTAGLVHQYNVETSLCVRTFQPANNRPFPIPDFALAAGKQYRYSRERERVAIEGEQVCKKRWAELSMQEKDLLDDRGCFSPIAAEIAKASSKAEVEALKVEYFRKKKNHGTIISKAFIKEHVAQVPDQHLLPLPIQSLYFYERKFNNY